MGSEDTRGKRIVHTMTHFEKKIYNTLINNSFLFLSETLKRLLDKDSIGNGKTDTNLITITCAELQISLELAIRATLVHSFGVKSILKSNQASLTETEIETLYGKNALKVTDFDKQKNLLKTHNVSRLTKKEFKEIDRFQVYRNKIVHFSCEFTNTQLTELRDEVLYYIVHVVLVLLADTSTGETPAEYLQSKLGFEFYERVMAYHPYVKAMEQYAKKCANPIWTCVGCFHRTYSPECDLCYCCGYETLTGYSRVDCGFCGTKKSVIYDNLDIHNEGNHHTMHGFCMKCEKDTYVYEYPVCGVAHDTRKDMLGKYCSEGQCINQSISK